ncbi:winged helix-turn-helix domain-containing protein [Stakelama saccharophila]|uniref:Winged helix-turn-helix domain-containing protein n=1 Tax=Stakelama saccharophila TaxID=3075605 RepID=A0ABZ0B9S4_9SPHN|nr:winged helix-turn-helix domain-containing protein [Stakelama sp. W311]WNO54045.1 winged helix-turn-helix domain-containing protein [Stakelama sp. W311]
MRFHDLTFDEMFASARRDNGRQITFTRKERAVLSALIGSEGRIVSRQYVLDVIDGASAEAGERNVDFLINRLRNKLGDKARNPRFIATQYGEGYLWIAPPGKLAAPRAFLRIGPVYGMDMEWELDSFPEVLGGELSERTGEGRVVLAEESAHDHDAEYTVEASLFPEPRRLHIALALRHGSTGEIVMSDRIQAPMDDWRNCLGAVSRKLVDAAWSHKAAVPHTISPTTNPLPVRVQEASTTVTGDVQESWRESLTRTSRHNATTSDNAESGLMRATALYTRLLHQDDKATALSAEAWDRIEDEIEELVLANLHAVKDNAIQALGAAKLLLFITRGYFDRAQSMAKEAFERSPAFAAAFATLGQFRACSGRFEESLSLYDRAIELSEPESDFHVYLLILKIVAFMACDDRERAHDTGLVLFRLRPETRLRIGLLTASPEETTLPDDLERHLRLVDKAQAAHMALYLYRISARQFCRADHQRNVMDGLCTHLARRFGRESWLNVTEAASSDRTRPRQAL